jgi:flagellar biogenesis protein FliO
LIKLFYKDIVVEKTGRKKMLKKFLFVFIFLCSAQNNFAEETLDNNIVVEEKQFLIAEENVEQSVESIDKNIFEPDFKKTFTKMLITLAIIIALVFVTFWMFKRLMKNRMKSANNSQSIRILETRPLSPKSMLYLVEVENEKVLLCESHLEVRNIHSVENETQNEEE